MYVSVRATTQPSKVSCVTCMGGLINRNLNRHLEAVHICQDYSNRKILQYRIFNSLCFIAFSNILYVLMFSFCHRSTKNAGGSSPDG